VGERATPYDALTVDMMETSVSHLREGGGVRIQGSDIQGVCRSASTTAFLSLKTDGLGGSASGRIATQEAVRCHWKT